MAKSTRSKILGIRMDEKMLRDVKAEAARRGVPVFELFEELWAKYRA
jgi:hypothetical protein